MSEPVFYIRGYPPGYTPFADPDMISDLRAVAELSAEQFNMIANALLQSKGFLDRARLKKLSSDQLGDARGTAVFRVLQNLQPNKVEQFLAGLDAWRKDPKNLPAMPDDVYARLRQVLPDLVRAFPAFDRFRKAERLARITGQPLEEIEIICDLRPVFDDKRENIEGMFPITTLRIVAQGVDGLPVLLEAQLTVLQLRELLEKAQKAEKKMSVLLSTIEKWIPNGLPRLRSIRKPTIKAPEESDTNE